MFFSCAASFAAAVHYMPALSPSLSFAPTSTPRPLTVENRTGRHAAARLLPTDKCRGTRTRFRFRVRGFFLRWQFLFSIHNYIYQLA